MRFSTISAVLAFAASVCAQTAGFDVMTSPTQDQNVPAGSSLDIIWAPSADKNGTVTITLLQGATPSTLELGDVVKAGIESSAGKFVWSVPSTAGKFATYGFKLTLDSDPTIFQYSFPFHITASSSTASVSSTSSSASGPITKTVSLATGTAYTMTPITTTTSSVNSTSSIIKTTSSMNSTTISTVTSVKPTGNSTLSFSSSNPTGASTSASRTATGTTTSSPAAATTNAAVANMAKGSMALFGGLVIAFAL